MTHDDDAAGADGLVTAMKAVRDQLWSYSRSPDGHVERERYSLAHQLNDAINAIGRSALRAPQVQKRPFNWPPDKGAKPSKWCSGDEMELHGWCANRNASECHCTCNCHKRPVAALRAPQEGKEPK